MKTLKSIFRKLSEAMEDNIAVHIVTLVEAPAEYKEALGQMMLVYPGGKSEGTIIDEATTDRIKEHIGNREWKNPILISLPDSACKVFWNRSQGPRQAIIAGGGHISLPLVEMLSLADFDVTVIDDRPEFANKARFPRAQKVVCEHFVQVLNRTEITEDTAVVIVTRGHRHDMDCLRVVLGSKARYIGMIGSRRRIKAIVDQFLEEGYDAAALQRLWAPIGLDIGAQSPGEIAVSIAAEILAVFRKGDCLSLSKKKQVK